MFCKESGSATTTLCAKPMRQFCFLQGGCWSKRRLSSTVVFSTTPVMATCLSNSFQKIKRQTWALWNMIPSFAAVIISIENKSQSSKPFNKTVLLHRAVFSSTVEEVIAFTSELLVHRFLPPCSGVLFYWVLSTSFSIQTLFFCIFNSISQVSLFIL